MKHAAIVTVALALTLTSAMGQTPAAGPAIAPLAPTGISDAPLHQIIPPGAVAHVRLNNLEKLAYDLNDLIMSVLPEEVVPPQFKRFLEMPKPALAFVGMQTFKVPLSGENVATLTGVDVSRPMQLSLYQEGPRQSFVACIPVAFFEAFTGMAMNILKSTEFVRTQAGTQFYYGVKSANPRSVYIMCSEKTAYICNSERLLQQMLSPRPHQPASTTSLHKFMADNEDKDLVLLADAAILKTFVPLLEQNFSQIPPPMIAKVREMIPPEVRARLELRIRLQLKFKSSDEFLDYLECMAAASYESLVSAIIEQVRDLNGLGVVLDLDEPYQSFKVAVFSDQIQPQTATAPIPMDDVKKAIAQLPGRKNIVTICGRKQKKAPSEFTRNWVRLVREKLKGKRIVAGKTEAFLGHINSHKAADPIGSIADWKINTSIFAKPDLIRADDKGIMDAVGRMFGAETVAPVSISMMPVTTPQVVDYYRNWIEYQTERQRGALELNRILMDAGSKQAPLTTTYRFDSELLANTDITRLVLQKSCATSFGLFGYDEHELINRRFVLCRPAAGYTYIETGSREPKLLNSSALGSTNAISQAVVKLLELVPENVGTVEFLSNPEIMIDVVAGLLDLEKLLHNELSAYLARVDAFLKTDNPALESKEALVADMPLYLGSINKDPESGRIYGVVLGGITYPRPAVMPAVDELLVEYKEKAGTLGGMVGYTRTLPGQYEVEVIQSSGALAFLVKSAVNNFYRKYMSGPEGSRNLQELLRGPYDGKAGSEELIANPNLKAFLGR